MQHFLLFVAQIRIYVINFLNQFDDYTLNIYLLQLVQSLKYEPQLNGFLTRFLMYRSLKSPYLIGHYFFWCMLAEYNYSNYNQNNNNLFNNGSNINNINLFKYQWTEKFGSLLEEYLLHLPNNLCKELFFQTNFMKRLQFINIKIIKLLNKNIKKDNIINILKNLLNDINNNKISITLPINPSLKIKNISIM